MHKNAWRLDGFEHTSVQRVRDDLIDLHVPLRYTLEWHWVAVDESSLPRTLQAHVPPDDGILAVHARPHEHQAAVRRRVDGVLDRRGWPDRSV